METFHVVLGYVLRGGPARHRVLRAGVEGTPEVENRATHGGGSGVTARYPVPLYLKNIGKLQTLFEEII